MSTFTIKDAAPLNIKPHKMHADSTKGMEGVREPLHKTGNFLYMMVGPPGSSKTTMIMHLLLNRDCFKRRFDEVHFYSPSLSTIDVPLPEERLHRGDLDVAEVEKTMKSVKQGDRALFIFDDCVASLPPGGKAIRPFIKMCYNRRHLTGKNAGIAIIIVSQKLTGIPRQLRAAADGIFYWRTANKKEIATFFDEYVSMDLEDFHRMLDFAWSDKYSFLFACLNHTIPTEICFCIGKVVSRINLRHEVH